MKQEIKSRQKATFKSVLHDARRGNCEILWNKAILANQIAKITRGHSRKLAYATKTRLLQQLVARGEVVVGTDPDYEYPLISVQFSCTQRLHAPHGSLEVPVIGVIGIQTKFQVGACKNV